MFVGPQKRLTLRLLGRPCVDHIIREVEVLRHSHFEISYEIVISIEIGLTDKSFYHSDLYLRDGSGKRCRNTSLLYLYLETLT